MKSKDFNLKFNTFCKEKNFRYFDFIKSIFESNYDELKIIAIDFLMDIP